MQWRLISVDAFSDGMAARVGAMEAAQFRDFLARNCLVLTVTPMHGELMLMYMVFIPAKTDEHQDMLLIIEQRCAGAVLSL